MNKHIPGSQYLGHGLGDSLRTRSSKKKSCALSDDSFPNKQDLGGFPDCLKFTTFFLPLSEGGGGGFGVFLGGKLFKWWNLHFKIHGRLNFI